MFWHWVKARGSVELQLFPLGWKRSRISKVGSGLVGCTVNNEERKDDEKNNKERKPCRKLARIVRALAKRRSNMNKNQGKNLIPNASRMQEGLWGRHIQTDAV
jgi:hypothetical protein